MEVDPALRAYEEFAKVYNDFNWANDYEMWFGALLPHLESRGLQVGRVLDVGCGTGRAFPPLLKRGWEVTACDLSPAMMEVARRDFGDAVQLSVADMRELPPMGEFELVVCMNDALNCLTGDGELERALAGMAANLAEGGLLMFDCNSQLVFSAGYLDEDQEVEHEGRHWRWRGLGPVEAGSHVHAARIEGDGIEEIVSLERYHPAASRHIAAQPLVPAAAQNTSPFSASLATSRSL